MLNELESLQTQNLQSARYKFIAAAWRKRQAKELLELAHEAGLSGPEADELLAKIRKSDDQITRVERLPRLRKDAADAKAKLDRVSARADAEIEKMQNEVQQAGFQSEEAFKAVCAAEADAQELLALHDERMLLTDIPDEVARLIERRDAEEKARVSHQAMREATDERDRCRHIVRAAEEALAHSPIVNALDHERHKDMLKDRVKNAQRQLDQAEKALEKAVAASEAARKAIQ